MAFEGRSLNAASQSVKDHYNQVLAHSVTYKPLVANAIDAARSRYVISFRDAGHPSTAVLRTRYGPVGLSLIQVCDAVPVNRTLVRLRTVGYQYRLFPEGSDDAAFRWEYVSEVDDSDALWCRYHVQGPLPTGIGGSPGISLNDFHLPTGPVAIEEVLRFCIVDLGVTPLSDDWHRRLRESTRLSTPVNTL